MTAERMWVCLGGPLGGARVEQAPSPREQRVAAALASLAPRDRQVLLLWEAGLTYSAIADQTGAAIGAIALMLSRARMHLLDAFDRMDAGFTEGGSFALESRPAAVSSVA